MIAPAKLLSELMRGAPFQPATNVWRAVELDAVQRHGLPSGRGLDLGCGDGKLIGVVQRAITKEGAKEGDSTGDREWIGVDMDVAETRLAVASGMYRRVHTCSADAIPEPDESFDFVFANSVLEHIAPIDAVLKEAARLLKPGGRLICTVPGPGFHDCLTGGGGRFGGGRGEDVVRDVAKRTLYLIEIDRRCAHLRYWGDNEWRTHLATAGLELELSKPYLSEVQTQRWETLSAWTGGLAWKMFGQGRRPIEIQRSLSLRTGRHGAASSVGSALSPLLSMGLPLSADVPAARYGCLLLDAVKPPAGPR